MNHLRDWSDFRETEKKAPSTPGDLIDLFCDNAKTLEQMLTEYRCDRNVAGVAPPSDQSPANAAAVMPCVVTKINTLTKAVYKDR